MENSYTLISPSGKSAVVTYGGDVELLAKEGSIDVYLVGSEDGFSPLGQAMEFLVEDLGIEKAFIKGLADWNRFKNDKVTLIAIPARRKGSALRGIVLCPTETCSCYERFARPMYGRPYRDFFYNVSYEAMRYAVEHWGCSRFALSHLSASRCFRPDIATCSAEALLHLVNACPVPGVLSLSFVGCCIRPEHLVDIPKLSSQEEQRSVHRPVRVQEETEGIAHLIHIDWTDLEQG